MKRIVLILFAFCMVQFANSQTNVFPTNGNVGIGTLSPSFKLDVVGSMHLRYLNATLEMGNADNSASYGSIGFNDATNYVEIKQKYSSGGIRFFTNTTNEKLVILQNGNIGIGISAPTAKLEVDGDINITTGHAFKIGGVTLSGNSQWQSSGSNILFNSGNVGIGTTSPNSKMEINHGTAGNSGLRFTQLNSASATTAGNGKVLSVNTSGDVILVDGGGSSQWSTSGNNISYNSGNVGIGISTPTAKLHILSTTNITPDSYGAGQVKIEGLGYTGYIALDATALRFGHNSAYRDLRFQTDETDRLTISSIGNVGIGTINPTSSLTIQKDVANSIGAGIHLINNQYAGNDGAETEIVFSTLLNNNNRYRYSKIHNIGGSNMGETYRLSMGMTDVNEVYQDILSIVRTGNVGIGTTNPTSVFEVNKDIDDIWTTSIKNGGGSSKGLLVEVGYGGDNVSTIMQLGDANGNTRVTFKSNGNVGIGVTNPQYKLTVEGTIAAREVKVTTETWADFVFKPAYKLRSLGEVEQFIKVNNHLPEIPTAAEVKENGVGLGEMNAKLLQKVEELTLYLIEQNKKIENLEKQIVELNRKQK